VDSGVVLDKQGYKKRQNQKNESVDISILGLQPHFGREQALTDDQVAEVRRCQRSCSGIFGLVGKQPATPWPGLGYMLDICLLLKVMILSLNKINRN